ncbi:MAG: lipoate--protein ligase family protein [Leptolyngbya sp. RL_3_1]|nr:lipoate--protein ligase family protein [Leptolyngbya sp. RL_3_1]
MQVTEQLTGKGLPRQWRLIPFTQGAGPWQMALDTWLLDQQIAGLQPPTLRFYTWQPVSLSLGYHQRHWPEHWQHLQWHGQGIPLVRRPSGGRAVLHQGDLCYGATLPLGGQRRQDCYRQICDGLIAGWQQLGVSLRYGAAGRGYIHNPSCFGTATAADLVTDQGYKLIGSAQLRRDRSLLQQGSMRLNPDRALTEAVFGTTDFGPIPSALRQIQPTQSALLTTLMETLVGAIAPNSG